MSFSTTANYGLKKPDVNTEIDAWGDDLNDNWDSVDANVKIAADAAAATTTALAGKANTSHTHSFVDITSGAATTAQITNGAVTNAKLENMPANTIKGVTATGTPTNLTAAQVNTILGVSGTVGPHTHPITDVTGLQTALDAKAPLASPALTGTPTAPTVAVLTNSTQVANAAHVYESVTKEQPNAKTVSYALVSSDAGRVVTFNSGTGVNCQVDASVFPDNARVDIIQLGAGQVTFTGSALRRCNPSSANKLTGQYTGATLWFVSATEYILIGNITV